MKTLILPNTIFHFIVANSPLLRKASYMQYVKTPATDSIKQFLIRRAASWIILQEMPSWYGLVHYYTSGEYIESK